MVESTLLEGEIRELKDLFEVALDDGADLLTAYETSFVESLLKKIDTLRNKFQLSENMSVVVKQIREKLEKEDLIT